MRTVIIVLISFLTIMESSSQQKVSDRQPVAAGRFYPAEKETLSRELAGLFSICVKSSENMNVRAIISPHAGYVFSGKTAASAFSATSENAKFKNIFIIGSSHIMSFEGASVYNTGDFITPLGRAVVNLEIANRLKHDSRVFNFPVDAHRQEHSIEVQIPFIQYYYKSSAKIIPVIIGTTNTNTIHQVAEALRPWFTEENLFVISSDFSHYPSYENAVKADNNTAQGLVSGNKNTFLATLKKNESENIPGLATSMCGWTSGLLLLELMDGDENLVLERIQYTNSGDSGYGNKDEVVGYHAIALKETRKVSGGITGRSAEVSFTEKEKEQLFTIARNSIKSEFTGNKGFNIDDSKIPEALKKNFGAFVTLKIDGNLRGCIGRFMSSDPLYKVVSLSAISSAFEDFRFNKLTSVEFNKVDIEITVLGPMIRINDIKEITLGKHGIYIKKDFQSGTMLPQVAIEQGWSVEEFLGYTSRDKAGLGWDGWKNAELYIYEGIVLDEKKR